MVRVPFIGLTGGMGSGKSTALELLAGLGAATLSADAVVHELYGEPAIVDAVVGRWGRGAAPDGVVDRSAVADLAFGDEGEREWLEQLLWPWVTRRLAAFRDEVSARVPPARAVVVEVPLLFESGLDRDCDATIAVVADEALRAQRVGARGHRAVDRRAARQLPQGEKAARATFAVDNSGSVEELERALSEVLATLERSPARAPRGVTPEGT